ncbi:unnamed protein product [Ophioblennius macclurei]
MADPSKDIAPRKDKKNAPSEKSHGARGKETTGKTKDSISTVSAMDELGHDDMTAAKTMPNTYQLGPTKRFPVTAVTEILRDALTTNLQLEKYEVEWARKMTKTLSEVIKAGVKDLMIPRYKIIVLVVIGELTAQGIQMNSRCLWDAGNDSFASYAFKNSHLIGVAIVYGVYLE